jgi:hypothetical protein
MLASGRPDASDGGRRNICVWDPTHHNQAIYLIRSYPHSLCCVHAGAPRDEGATKLVDVRPGAGSLLPCLPAAWSHEGWRSSTGARPRRQSSSAARLCLGLPLHEASHVGTEELWAAAMPDEVGRRSSPTRPRRGQGRDRRGRSKRPGARELTGDMGSLRRGAGELLQPPRTRAVELDPGRRGRGGAPPASARAPRLARRSYQRHAPCPFCTASPRFRTAVSPSPNQVAACLHVAS